MSLQNFWAVFRETGRQFLFKRIGRLLLIGSMLPFVSVAAPLPQALQPAISAPQAEANSWVLMEADSGWVIAGKAVDQRVDPASLTKLMTTYLVFEALQVGRLKDTDTTIVSKKAWKAPGSRMFIEVDKSVSIGDLLRGLVVQSGNDAAVALAEHVAGSESAFASLMNQKAVELGLSGTHFINASGLPDPEHYTTAMDVAILSQALIRNFPAGYALFKEREYTFNDITQPNRNRLLWRDASFDGLKTGHTEAAGYCLAGSGERDGLRFIAVVMGAGGAKARVQAVQSLLEYGFSMFKQEEMFAAGGEVKTLPLYKGESDMITVHAAETLAGLIPVGGASIELKYQLNDALEAPLAAGQTVGKVGAFYGDVLLDETPLQVVQDYPQGSIWTRVVDTVRLMLN